MSKMRTTRNKKNKTYRWDEILKFLPKDTPLIGAEIGVWEGLTSKALLQSRPLLKLFMVDRWQVPTPEDSFYDTDNISKGDQLSFDAAKAKTLSRVAPYDGRYTVIGLDSVSASLHIEDSSLDFVFIDGDHSYDGCFNDLKAWVPKVKLGGLIMGHDYGRPDKGQVSKAVHDFFGPLKDVKVGAHYCWRCYK